MKKPEIDITKQQKEIVKKKVEDCVHDLLYNSRKEDKELSSELLFSLIGSKIISTSEIINAFAKELRKEVA